MRERLTIVASCHVHRPTFAKEGSVLQAQCSHRRHLLTTDHAKQVARRFVVSGNMDATLEIFIKELLVWKI
jgi:hypothetical protein